MKCPNCDFDSPDEMLFCGMCGYNLARACPACGQVMPLEFRFCGKCGTQFEARLPETERTNLLAQAALQIETSVETTAPRSAPEITPIKGQRRQATIVVADVKGSTELMEQIGTEAWVEVMNKVLQVSAAEIQRFGGEVDQFRGDGLVAFYGARSAHEDDPERAVLSALMIQNALEKLNVELSEQIETGLLLRIGLNTGEVIAANIGNHAQHSEDTAMGGAVALAARMENAAEPGTVLVSESTYRLTENRFRWEALGERIVQGISQPVAVYRPLAPLTEVEQAHRLQEYGLSIPMIGRDYEIETLDKTVKQLRDGIGGIVLMSGEAGVGKTRLLSEIEQNVMREEAVSPQDEGRVIWLQGRCRSYGHSIPHSMWVDVLHRWLGMWEWEDQSDVLAQLHIKTKELWGDQYNEYYPYLAKFLSLPLEKSFPDWVEHLEAEGLRHQFFVVIKSWVQKLAQQSPLVIAFTEVHWADEASLDILKYCLSLCDQEAVLWMIVYRPDRMAPTWRFSHFVETEYPHRVTSLNLKALDETKSIELLNRLIGVDTLPQDMVDAIIQRSEGNPYYLTELIRSLVDRGILVYDAEKNGWKTTQTNVPLELPNSLISLLTARLTRLSLQEQRVLQLAAIVGTVFWSELLQALIGDDTPVDAVLAALQRARLIRERRYLSDLGKEYVFLSALIRDAAYESLIQSQRVHYHLLAAEFLESVIQESVLPQYHGLIAYHYRQAEVCQKELFHTLLAAENAQKVYANSEAIHQYTLALELLDRFDECPEPPPQHLINEWRLEALTGLGQTYFGIGEIDEAETHLRAAVALGREIGINASALTHLFYWLGEVLFWQNHYEEPIHLGEEGLYYLGENNKNIEAALMNQLVAIGCSQLGDHDKFIDFTLRTAGFIQDLPYTEELRPAYDHIIGLHAYTLKDIPEAERWLAVFKRKAQESHDLRAMGEVYNHTASLLNRQGDIHSAVHSYGKAIEQFTQIGDYKHTCRSLRGLGTCHLQAGHLDQAEESIQLSLEKAQVIDNPIDFALGYWFLAQIKLCRGLRKEARANFDKAQEIAKGIAVIKAGWAFLGLGQIHFSHANADEIIGNYQSTLEKDAYLVYRNPYQAANILSKLERTFEKPEDFRTYVDQFRQHHHELDHAQFHQWYLTPGEITLEDREPLYYDVFRDSIPDDLKWVDPFGDCSYQVDQGLTIQAANERNFHHINRSAPRFVYTKPLKGDFVLQTTCRPISDEKPAIGGLLVWQNDKNWLCLEFGSRGPDEVIFRGFKDNHDMVFGRGRLHATTAYLRLEKYGYQVNAFCSSDGENWFFAGRTNIPSGEPVYPGLHANGHINRLIYPGAYPFGAAIRFDAFWLWGS